MHNLGDIIDWVGRRAFFTISMSTRLARGMNFLSSQFFHFLDINQ